MPMLDETEYQECWALMQEALAVTDPTSLSSYIQKHGLANVSDGPIQPAKARELINKPVFDAYERITGYRETNINAIWHHRISIYGSPCQRCGKVLRTPFAFKCFECGKLKDK
jgi:hypothetical protein